MVQNSNNNIISNFQTPLRPTLSKTGFWAAPSHFLANFDEKCVTMFRAACCFKLAGVQLFLKNDIFYPCIAHLYSNVIITLIRKNYYIIIVLLLLVKSSFYCIL